MRLHIDHATRRHVMRAGRLPVPLILAAFLASTLTVVAAPPALAAAPSVTASISGGSILAGETGTFSLSAHNGGAVDGYNLAVFVDVPDGITFESSSWGTPVIYTASNPPSLPLAAGMQRWVWEDISDLPAGGSQSGTVTVRPEQPPAVGGVNDDTTVSPVGADVTLTATAALSGDPTYLPVFNGSTGVGGATAESETGTSAAASATVSIVSLRVSLAEPSPEAELERGVHDHTTVYTLTVRATTEGDTDNSIVTSYVPAGLEFLGCGGVDNSTVDRDAADGAVNEYDGAATLAATPTLVATCLTPSSVTTIQADAALAASAGLTQGAVYTAVAWDLGTLAAGSTTTLTYRAGVPLQENTLAWDGPEPTGASLGQASNLDNNNGPSTRHGAATAVDGPVWTTVATVAGDYAGVTRTGTDRSAGDRASESVYGMDLSILKSVDGADSHFSVGNIANFTLQLLASEYMSSTGIVVTDELPNGLCPLLPSGASFTLDPGASVPAECEAVGTLTGAQLVSATAHADGTFTLVMQPTDGGDPADFELAANATHAITYEALNRTAYVTATEYGSTTSGDSFRNTVDVTGTTHAIPALAAAYPGTLEVWDDSSASIASDYTTIDKRVMPRDEVEQGLADGVDPCTAGSFQNGTAAGFRLGDTVCFELRVTFPSSIDTRNPVVTDFLPEGLTYGGYEVAASSTAPVDDTTVTSGGTAEGIEWTLGTPGAGGDLYVARGSVFVAHVWAVVNTPSNGTELDKPANLMKYRQQSVTGALYFLRDQADVEVDPELELTKGVEYVTDHAASTSYTRTADSQDDADGSTFLSNRDGIVVTEGETVGYRVDLHGLPYDATAAELWDLLPAGITKADVSGISAGGTALDPGDPGYPAGLAPENQTRSVIVWTGIAVPGGEATLRYAVTIPTPTGVSTTLDNTASIISYAAGINTSADPAAQTYIPAGSLDTSLASSANTDGTNTTDDSEVRLPSPSLVKGTTSPADTNNTAGQVVIGELATSTYTVTIPAYTSVRDASLTDTYASSGNWATVPGHTTVAYPGGTTAPGDTSFDLGGQTFTVNTATGALTFPSVYTNATASDQTFTVTLDGYIKNSAGWTHQPASPRNDTARFAATGTTTLTATAGVALIEPSPGLTKVADDDTVTAGQTLTYTITASNASGRPTLFDTVVTDCVPPALLSVTLGSASQGSAVLDTDPGCASGQHLTWTVGDIDGGASATLDYTVQVSPAAAGDASYTNTASLAGYSLASGAPDRRTYTKTSQEVVTVEGGSLTKTVDAPTATIGEQRDYTVTVSLPANVNFYDAAIIDDVPAGLALSGASISCQDSALASCTADLASGTPALSPSGTLQGWWLGDIASDPLVRTITLTYTGTVLNVVGNENATTLTNTARLRWNSSDVLASAPADASYTPDATTSPGTATVTVREPSITIDKTVGGAATATVDPGDTFTYAVKASNGGTSTAYGLTVTDVVPTGVVVDAGTITGGGVLTGAGANGGGTITWTVASIAASGSTTFTYDATLADSTTLSGAALTNTATATTYYSHPTGAGYDTGERRTYNGPNDTAAVTPGFPVLTLTKGATGTVAYVGQEHTFTVTIGNTGSGPATHVVATDVLPDGFSYVADSAVMTPGADLNPSVSGQTLTWDTLPDIAAGGTVTIQYRAVPRADYTWTTANTGNTVHHTNTASAVAHDAADYASHFDGVTYTATDDAYVTIDRADLRLEKTHSGAIVAGSTVTWSLTVTNDGPDPAVGPMVITDTLPAGATLQSISGAGWSAGTPDGSNVVELTRNTTLASGDSTTVTVTASFAASAAAGTDATNDACVDALTLDLNAANDCDSDPGTVTVLADLQLDKVATGSSYTAGEDITWTVSVTNNGPSDSHAPFTVVDTLPSSVDWATATASGTGWACDPVDTGAGTLTCVTSSGTLTPGSSLPDLTVTATVKPSWTGTVVNTATVTGTTPEPTVPGTTNNTDTVTTGSVDTSADLELVKTLASTDLTAGGTGRYRVAVTNHGPSDALVTVVTDQLPTGLTYAGGLTSASGDTWSCAASGTVAGQVDCTLDSNLGTLPAGASTWFEFDVDVASSVTGTVTNEATASSDTPDPDLTNNTDDVSVTPVVVTNLALDKTHPTAPTYRVGDEVTFTLTVTNDGKADARTVSIDDALPDGVTFVRVENAAGWTVTGPDGAGHLTLALDDPLAAGATPTTASIDVVVTLDADAYPSVTNAATVSTVTTETTTADNADTDTVTVHSPDLEIVKTADATVVEGGDSFTYTLAVSNVDPDAWADDVRVTDAIPTDLRVTSDPTTIGSPAWTCALAGTDADGFGGTLTCDLATLLADTDAATLVFDVEVAADVARDTIANTATVSSPDEHADRVDAHNSSTATVTVKWIDLTASSVCLKDAPWLQLGIDPHNVADGLPVTLTWYPDANGDSVPDGPAIATQTLAATTDGSPLAEDVLWPGAEVDADGVGVAWPGYRVVTAGETPTWENLILDPSLPEYALRDGALVTVTINPEASSSQTYPMSTPTCEVARPVVLDIDKSVASGTYHRDQLFTYTMVVSNTSYGATDDAVMTDTVPSALRVTSIDPQPSTDPTVPDWRDCAMTGQDASGNGGLLTCVLDGWLGYGQTAPPIELTVAFAADATLGPLTNVATISWTDPDEPASPTYTASDDAQVIVVLSAAEILAMTGVTSIHALWWAAGLVTIGWAILEADRRRGRL